MYATWAYPRPLLCSHSLCLELLYDILVCLLKNREILKSKRTEIVRSNGLTQTPVFKVTNMWGDMKRHKTTLDLIYLDLRPDARQSIMRTVWIIGSRGRGGRWLVFDFFGKRLQSSPTSIKIFRILGILGLRDKLSFILEQCIPVNPLKPRVAPNFFPTRGEFILAVRAKPLLGIYAKQLVYQIFSLRGNHIVFLVRPLYVSGKYILKDLLCFTSMERRVAIKELE